MTRLGRRKIIDIGVIWAVALPLFLYKDWLGLVLALIFGMWNYYDGLTRADLD